MVISEEWSIILLIFQQVTESKSLNRYSETGFKLFERDYTMVKLVRPNVKCVHMVMVHSNVTISNEFNITVKFRF